MGRLIFSLVCVCVCAHLLLVLCWPRDKAPQGQGGCTTTRSHARGGGVKRDERWAGWKKAVAARVSNSVSSLQASASVDTL
jgi:hypothetical protein